MLTCDPGRFGEHNRLMDRLRLDLGSWEDLRGPSSPPSLLHQVGGGGPAATFTTSGDEAPDDGTTPLEHIFSKTTSSSKWRPFSTTYSSSSLNLRRCLPTTPGASRWYPSSTTYSSDARTLITIATVAMEVPIRLCVGNIHFLITEDDLKDVLKPFGQLEPP